MINLRKTLSVALIAIVAIATVGCTKEEAKKPETDASTQASAVPEVTNLEWDAQPQLGIIKGDYYLVEERFRQGHLGSLEVVVKDNNIELVEFNEATRPNYYNRKYQNVPKRYSEYNFSMGEAKGAAWIQSVEKVEKQMVKEQRLVGEFDIVSGASNSIEQAMAPMAEKLNAQIGQASNAKAYIISEKLGGGLTGRLKVVVENGKITLCKYDEIFANTPEEIEDAKLKGFYRQSKYDSIEYDEPSRIGFNVQMDSLNSKVIETQNLLDITDLPAVEDTGDYKSAGYTKRNTAWDNYLKLADKLLVEMKADGIL